MNKVDYLQQYLVDTENNFSVIGTWLDNNTESLVHLPNYSFINTNRTTKTRGGVGMSISPSINYSVQTNLNLLKEDILESIFTEASKQGKDKIVKGKIYKPPGNNNNRCPARWQEMEKNCPTDWKDKCHADCAGSYKCKKQQCPFKVQYGVINTTQFENKGDRGLTAYHCSNWPCFKQPQQHKTCNVAVSFAHHSTAVEATLHHLCIVGAHQFCLTEHRSKDWPLHQTGPVAPQHLGTTITWHHKVVVLKPYIKNYYRCGSSFAEKYRSSPHNLAVKHVVLRCVDKETHL